MAKFRVDKLLVDQGLVDSRTKAQGLVMAGQVCVGDKLVLKPSEMFLKDTVFRLKEGANPKYVSRGGEKLQGALLFQKLDLRGLVALDIGQSTGGFTDCLLQAGVKSVIGLDVGHNQLAWSIRNDPRVKSFEGINCRQIPEDLVPSQVDIIVIDVSFISLELILPEAAKYLKPRGIILALIKPQFEVEKGQIGKGGIVKDSLLHLKVQEKIKGVCEKLGFVGLKVFPSMLEGTDGNKEFFITGNLDFHLRNTFLRM